MRPNFALLFVRQTRLCNNYCIIRPPLMSVTLTLSQNRDHGHLVSVYFRRSEQLKWPDSGSSFSELAAATPSEPDSSLSVTLTGDRPAPDSSLSEDQPARDPGPGPKTDALVSLARLVVGRPVKRADLCEESCIVFETVRGGGLISTFYFIFATF